MRESRAWNQSIYLMVAMPYLVLGVFSFMIYRGYRKGRSNGPGADAFGRVVDVSFSDASQLREPQP